MSAKYTPPQVETKVIEVAPARVVLEVTPRFAAMLAVLYSGVGGHPDTTLRGEWAKLSDSIEEALPHSPFDYDTGLPDRTSIYFKNFGSNELKWSDDSGF